MSQQRILIALCLFGAIAMVSAQRMDLQACSKKARDAAFSYQATLTQAMQEYTNELQKHGLSAVDTSKLNSQLDQMTNTVNQMTNFSDGVDIGKITQSYMSLLSTGPSMAVDSFQFSMVSGMIGTNFKLGQTIYKAQTSLTLEIAKACMPQNRVQPSASI